MYLHVCADLCNYPLIATKPEELLAPLRPFVSPDWFIAEQISQPVAPQSSDNARLVALQLGNAYMLLCMLGLAILTTTTEVKVVKSYLVALWVADIGHIGVTYYMLGHEKFMAVGDWNAMTWGNIAATTFLFLTRTAYLLGVFGPDRIVPVNVAKKAI